jgi:hypothetical protein
VTIEVVGPSGEVLARGRTDAAGAFDVARGPSARSLRVWARTETAEHDVAIAHDPTGTSLHFIEAPLAPSDAPLEVLARDDAPGGPAGAFHILDTMLVGLERAERWTGRDMPPVFVYWGRGVTTEWSFYRGEVPAGSGRYAFELLGGDPGRQDVTDTDEHDEAIIVHELGHMVMDLVSTDSSFGGRHPPGFLVDPGLAWEEGRVSWFATAALGDPAYLDTVGLEPRGSLRVDRDYSRVNPGPRGLGSEQTVGEVLWDLADGTPDLPDDDGDDDGVALGPEGVMRAMMDLAGVDGAYPCLATFLRFLVVRGRVAELTLKALLERTGQPASLLPGDDRSVWPVDVALDEQVEGEIDGLSNPAPSGGPPLPTSGYDAVRAYRFRVAAATAVDLTLTIRGSGLRGDAADLDLEVRDLQARLLAEARTESATERVAGLALGPGWYVAYVRDGGGGSRAAFSLRVASRQ